MTTAVGLLLVLLGGHYAYRLASWSWGLQREARRPAPEPSEWPRLSVVVAARNEEDAIGACLDALLAQDYPADRIEILVADDDSTDRTASIVRETMLTANVRATPLPVLATPGAAPSQTESAPGMGDGAVGDGAAAPHERVRLVRVPHDPARLRAHKKRAIETAVAQARGEIILTTDADCLAPPAWARTLAAPFADPDVAFVSGPVRYRLERGPFLRLQALDFFALMLAGAGAIAQGEPHLANGASVAYRRSVFRHLGGFSGIDDITSGDDELLMQKVAYGAMGPGAVRAAVRPDATVVTEGVRTARALLDQRTRWASKGGRYPLRLKGMLGLGLAFFVLLFASALALPAWPALLPWVLGALALRVGADLALLVPGARLFGQSRLLGTYPLFLLVHIPAALGMGVLGAFGDFEWKGRRLDR